MPALDDQRKHRRLAGVETVHRHDLGSACGLRGDFKLACGALGLRPGRRTIVTEPGNFPTDLYVLRGLERLLGGGVRVITAPRSELPAAIDDDTAAVVLTHVHYKTAERWPIL